MKKNRVARLVLAIAFSASTSAWADWDEPYRIVRVNPRAREIAVATLKTLEIIGVENGASVKPEGVSSPAEEVAYSTDGTRLAASFGDGTLVVWDAATGKSIKSFKTPGYTGRASITLNAGGTLLAASVGLKTWLWDVGNGSLVKKWNTSDVRGVAFSPTGKRFALSGSNIQFLGPDDAEPVETSSRGAQLMSWSPDGSRIVGASINGNYYTINAATAETVASYYENDSEHKAEAITVSADGKSIWVKTPENIDQLELETLKRIGSWPFSESCKTLEFGAERSLFACGLPEQSVMLVTLGQGEPKVAQTVKGKEALSGAAQKAFCGTPEYTQSCQSQKMVDYYWKVCLKAGTLDRNDEDKVKEWSAAAKDYPAAHEAYSQFKSKYHSCYSDNHDCRVGGYVEECLAAGEKLKAQFAELLAGVKQEIEFASTRTDSAVENVCGASLDHALTEVNSADRWLAQAQELAKIPFLAGNTDEVLAAVVKGKEEIRAKVNKARIADELKWKPFTSVLSGARLKYFNDNFRCGVSVYGPGGAQISTPAQFKSANLMCTYTIDRNGIQPRWETTCWTFKKDKQLSPAKVKNGWGNSPPSANFR